MVTRVTLPAKNTSELVNLIIDFSQFLLTGQSVISGTCTGSVYAGVETSPVLTVGATTVTGTSLQTEVTGGTIGVIYLLKWIATCTGTPSSQQFVQESLLAIVTSGP